MSNELGGRPHLGQLYRKRVVAVGLLLVASANLVFALMRWLHQQWSGLATPWWVNAIAALALASLYLWYQRRPYQRASVAIHVAASVAVVGLLIPLAYGYVSSVWWLSLIAVAMLMAARRSAAVFWCCLIMLLVGALTVWLHLYGGVSRLPSEPMPETMASALGFALISSCLALSFRLVVLRQAQLLRRQGIELTASNQAKDRFLRHISHELRTPLHGILALTDQVLAQSRFADHRRQLLGAHRASEVLLRHLEDLFEYAAEPTAHIAILNPAPLSIRSTLRSVLDVVDKEAARKGLRLCLRVDQDVVDHRLGDAVRLAQLALKLVSNAVRFTREGQVEVELSVWSQQPGGVQLCVRDTGIGIAEDAQELIFTAFHRTQAGKAGEPGGLGLGLAIAQRLAHLMQGCITVESRLGFGSCFLARMVVPECPDTALEQARSRMTTAAKRPTPIRILVCDDDAVCRIILGDGLAAAGHQVTVAEDGLQGWSLWQQARYDVVLTDLEMPQMDGHELLRRIRARESPQGLQRTSVVAVSAGRNLEATAMRINEAAFDGFLRKPFLIRDALGLLEQVRTSLAQRTDRQSD